MNQTREFLSSHGHHLLFGLAILSLASLLSWWSVFIHRSIVGQRQVRMEIMSAEMREAAARLRLAPSNSLVLGTLGSDGRFELSADPGDGPSLPLEGRGLYLRPRVEVLGAIAHKNRSLTTMWLGESGLMSLIVLASIFFLYRDIRIERRTLNEVRDFWERSAHEIKTPIAGLKAFLQNLKILSPDLGSLGNSVDLALRQVDRQERLANNILAGYRLDMTKAGPRLESFDLGGFLDDYFRQDALHLGEAVVARDSAARPPVRVRADRRFLKVILDNVTVNAAKYAPRPLVLGVDIAPRRGTVDVSISDNGPGFPPELSENIFQAYRRSASELPATLHGTGLGLFISRRLARSMGGDLRASSPGPGLGARLTLTLKAETNAA